VLADDHAIVRAGLKAVLGAAPDIDVVGEASNGAEAIALAEHLTPDVVVMDLSMAGMDGITATKALAAIPGAPRVLVLTMHAEEDYLVPLIEAGAMGYLVKSVADRELIDALRTVARGELYVRPSAAVVLAKGIRKKEEYSDARTRYDRLAEREREVFGLVAAGYTAPEIGERLDISPKTVDTYKQRINEKLGVQHRADYVRLALKLGLLGDEEPEAPGLANQGGSGGVA
jgi:DNA-binding NarL/FixJ family response regulator